MSDIQRWGPQEIVKGRDWVPAEMMVYSEGEWVLFTDYQRDMAEKDARIKELEAALDFAVKANEGLDRQLHSVAPALAAAEELAEAVEARLEATMLIRQQSFSRNELKLDAAVARFRAAVEGANKEGDQS